MCVYPNSGDSSNEPVKWVLNSAFPHVVQSFAAFTYSSKLYILQQGGGQSLNDYMRVGIKFSSKTLLRQLSGIAKTIQELSDVHLVRGYQHKRARSHAFGLTPERLLVFPDGPFILRLFIDISNFTGEVYWDAHPGDYDAPEAVDRHHIIDWCAEMIWWIGCTYLEILIWHFMGYDGLCDFRNRRSQHHSRPYFFSPAEPGTNGGAREHEAVVSIFQVLLSQSDGYVPETVHSVRRMLAIRPSDRPTASSVALVFRDLATQE